MQVQLSLNQGEKILSSHDYFQLSRATKSKKILLSIEAVLFVGDSSNTFDTAFCAIPVAIDFLIVFCNSLTIV